MNFEYGMEAQIAEIPQNESPKSNKSEEPKPTADRTEKIEETKNDVKPEKKQKGKKIKNEGFKIQETRDRSDTFVGTPLYVSPEMLEDTKSTPASDLWALGCIIYRMHAGSSYPPKMLANNFVLHHPKCLD